MFLTEYLEFYVRPILLSFEFNMSRDEIVYCYFFTYCQVLIYGYNLNSILSFDLKTQNNFLTQN